MEAAVAFLPVLWWERRDRKSDSSSRMKAWGEHMEPEETKYTILYLIHTYTTESWINIKDGWSVSDFSSWYLKLQMKTFLYFETIGIFKYWSRKWSVGEDMEEEREVWRTVGNKTNLKVEMLYRREDACQVQQTVPWKKSSTGNTHLLRVKQTLPRNAMCRCYVVKQHH